MIEARRNRLFEPLFYRVLKWQMRRRFHGIYVAGFENLNKLEPGRAVIACANHTNWWDGFVVELLTRQFPGRRFYLAQEERHLRRYRWLTWLGVFGIDLEGSALPGLRYALGLLKEPENVVWMFPQGRIEQPSAPIVQKRGVSFLAQRSGAQLLSLIIKYEWLLESRPSIFVRIGEPGQELEVVAGLCEPGPGSQTPATTPGPGGTATTFKPLMPPRMSLNKKWDWLRWRLSGGKGSFERENR